MNQRRASAERDPKLICVVDDDTGLLASYCALLESAGFVPIPYPSGAMLLADDKYLRAGCVLLDLHMPPPDGMETLKRIRAEPQAPPVVMITGEGDIPTAVEAMKCGAFDFEEKPVDGDVLIRLVELAGSSPLDQPKTDLVPSSHLDSLTEREKQVLSCLLEGATNKEIARELGISHRTVEVHRANIMEKSGAESLSKLILMAVGARQH